ncbi:MarR family transcriptional regulator [Actinomadura sp. NPDC048032]|uniref:MarR family winged helix-turn-helix transcriptional regulator n=1 Tax=Actinomadura TaxID=1988 RepID=UPI0031ECCD77
MRDDIDDLADAWRRDGLTEPFVAMLELSKRAGRVATLVQQALRGPLAELGLTYAEFEVLTVLRREGEPYRLRPSELTRSAFLTSGGTSNVLQRLQKAGYVEREANAGDARSRFVQLTADGLRVTEQALVASGVAHEEVLARVPPEDVRAAADALREIVLVVGRRRLR